MKNFEPTIIVFACNECAYAAADLAGTSHFRYPTNIRIIRVPCSGQVDILHILKTFESGADGVLVEGCLKDQCHYVDGNYKAEERVNFLRDLLQHVGIEKDRLNIYFISAAMADEFARVSNEFTGCIKALGPSPLKKLKKKSPLSSQKRELLRNMLLSISKELNTSKAKIKGKKYVESSQGFGEPILDEKQCIGCGACSFVCKDNAMTVEEKKDHALLKHIYWRCTACGTCVEICPKDCLEIKEGLDLSRFLFGKENVKTRIEMRACERCGTRYLPILVGAEAEKILSDGGLSAENISSCPKCRIYDRAEKVSMVQKTRRVGKLKVS